MYIITSSVVIQESQIHVILHLFSYNYFYNWLSRRIFDMKEVELCRRYYLDWAHLCSEPTL